MAAITLRDYVREIEKQVDGSRNEEAIAHSRHVLESFPKHVDVYRLLGKAYLESQRYGDAGDIFQRVLSAVPEDFVSHVGMSIIREDEGNLDEAIWHMERAFDVQPSNGAIQEELRRLYGRRDNVEPPKIRLTRGALARMYYRGELYPQAISELRAALNENPERLDLQALLAEVYARAGQRVEAVDMASQVLRRLPFCLAANQIMMEMLIGSDRESEIETYYQRLCQLDPYTAHVNAAAPRAADVPDQAIRLNKLDYKASQATEAGPGQPVWAATLGIEVAEMATGREETLPEWLAAGPSTLAGESELVEGGQVPAFAGDEAQLEAGEEIELLGAAGEEEQIPDWMKEMGWGPAGPESQSAEAASVFDEEQEAPTSEGELPEAELASAEIPDWLKAMAPAGALAEAEAEEDSEEEVAPWLDQLFAAETPAGEAADVEKPEEEAQPWPSAGLALGAAVIGAAARGDDETLEGAEPLEAETPPLEEVMKEMLLEDQPVSAIEELEVPEELAGEQTPDWLAEIALAEELASTEPTDELPDWLRESLAPAAEPAAEALQPEEMGGWSFEEAPSEEVPGGEVTAEAAAEEGEVLPAWLFESETAEAAPADAAPAEPAAEVEEELPGWLFESETIEEAPAVTAAENKEDLPDWLFEAATVEGAEELAEQGAEEAEGIPDWLKAAGAVTGGVAAFQASEWLSEEKEPEAAELEGEMEPEPVEALLAEELPEWLRGPVDLVETVAAEETILPVEEAVTPLEAGQIEAVSPEARAIAPEENPELAEALAWLDLMLTPVEEVVEATAHEAPPPPVEAAPGAEQLMDEDAAFAWLESLAARQGAQEALLLKPEDRLETPPEWVLQASQEASEAVEAEAAEAVEETPSAESEAAAEPEAPAASEAPLDEEAAFAWLESLAVRQGAQEALLLKPEERQETPPEWVTAAGVAAAAGLMAEKAQDEEPLAEQDSEAHPAEPVEETAEPVEAVQTTGQAQEFVAEPAAPASPAAEVEAPPELPDWLAAPASETREETLEWTPPPLSRRKYDLNKITLVEMERLPGIGFIMAQRIIDYRNTHGPFKKIDDLLNVPEFNMAALEGVRENLYLEVSPEPAAPAARTPTQPRPGTGPLVLATGAGLPKEVVKAREQLSKGYIEPALEIYDKLVRSKKHLSWVIEDLSEATNQYPAELYVWQSLGDAYLRSDQPSQALQAYIRAEKLLLQ